MGLKYFISVSEPWDFDSPDGQNIINGVIIKMLSATCLIFRANYNLNFGTYSGRLFALYPRHLGSDFNDFEKGLNYVAINGNLLTDAFDENLGEEAIKERSNFVLMGTIRQIL